MAFGLFRHGLLALLSICSGLVPALAGDTAEQGTEDTSARDTFAELERTLLERDFVLDFKVVSSGAYESLLAGMLEICRTAEVSMQADGHFAQQAAAIRLRASDGLMSGGNGAAKFAQATPANLREALVLGLTRMGILHNLAVMSGGSPPDHAGIGVGDWVQVKSLRLGATEELDGVSAKTLRFTVVVNGEDAGTATLWVDDTSGMPLRREQVVRFGDAEMRVVESYSALTLYPR